MDEDCEMEIEANGLNCHSIRGNRVSECRFLRERLVPNRGKFCIVQICELVKRADSVFLSRWLDLTVKKYWLCTKSVTDTLQTYNFQSILRALSWAFR